MHHRFEELQINRYRELVVDDLTRLVSHSASVEINTNTFTIEEIAFSLARYTVTAMCSEGSQP